MPDLDMMGGEMPQKPDNHEASMARADLYKSANYSFKLFKMIQDGQELEGWVQAKITKAADYIASVYHYMEYEMKFNDYGKKLEDADVYSESVKQQFVQKLTEARVKMEKLKAKNIKDLDEGWDDMIKAGEKRKAEKGTGKFDSKKTSTGTVYTRKSSTYDDGGKDKDQKRAEKKAKSTNEEVDKSKIPAAQRKAKGGDWKVSKADLDKEASKSPTSKAGLAKLKKDTGVSEELKGGQKKLDVNKNGKLDGDDFKQLRSKKKDESIVAEKAVSKAQQKFMGMVHAAKKGEKPASKAVATAAKGMSAKAAKDYASTKHKGLPAKKD